MDDTSSKPFIEKEGYWRSVSRAECFPQGIGKWKLYSKNPQRVYKSFREALLSGKMEEVTSIKVRAKTGNEVDKVYVYTGPYTDLDKITQLAEKIVTLVDTFDLKLERPLEFKTDLHTVWQKVYSSQGGAYHKLLHTQKWLYRYQNDVLTINDKIQDLHQKMETCHARQDVKLMVLYTMMPSDVFARE